MQTKSTQKTQTKKYKLLHYFKWINHFGQNCGGNLLHQFIHHHCHTVGEQGSPAFRSLRFWSHSRPLREIRSSKRFKPVTTDDVLEKLSALRPNKATGHDNVPTRFLRDAAASIAPVVAHITNLSISQCHVPQDFKVTRVIPLYKKGNKLEPSNYRPVFILCSTSKVIERLIHDQTLAGASIQPYRHLNMRRHTDKHRYVHGNVLACKTCNISLSGAFFLPLCRKNDKDSYCDLSPL